MALDPRKVTARIEFLEGYAAHTLDEFYRQDLELNDSRLERTARIDDLGRVLQADAATALREAGQWCLYVDIPRAKRLLARAGSLFADLGYPFGLFLLTVAGEGGRQRIEAGLSAALQSLTRGADREIDTDAQFDTDLQQEVYVLLAAAGGTTANRYDERLEQIMQASRTREGVIPVGALGTPAHQLWACANGLLHRKEGFVAVADHLLSMARRYEETMTLAQVNRYLWRNAAAAVDVGDIDISGITALAARRFGEERVSASLQEMRLGPVGRAPIDVGIQMGSAAQDLS